MKKFRVDNKMIASVFLILILIISGCGMNKAGSNPNSSQNSTSQTDAKSDQNSKGSDAKNKSADKPIESTNKPVTLTAFVPGWASVHFKNYVQEPVKKKYPNIKFKIISGSLSNDLVKGEKPDLVLLTPGELLEMNQLKLSMDISPLIKKSKLDLSKFNPSIIQAVKGYLGDNKLTALPFLYRYYALYYNKDIFDKFGVPYPKDGMTWDKAIQLGKRLTRKVDGTQYYGLITSTGPHIPASELGAGLFNIDKQTKIGTSQKWETVFKMMTNMYKEQGIHKVLTYANASKAFNKDKTVAMFAGSNNEKDGQNVNWDMVSYPVFPQAKDSGPEADIYMLAPTATSKYKDIDFKVIQTAVSVPVQEKISKDGLMTVFNDKKIQSEFGSGDPYLKGKHLQSMFDLKVAMPHPKFNGVPIVDNAFTSVIEKGVDINTALRDAQEKLQQMIKKNYSKK